MAAERLVAVDGLEVAIFDAMPSPGRKFLMAGKGGMNITHAEPFADFAGRYGSRQAVIEPLLKRFGPQQLREWIHGLGIETFVGTSGRVFPTEMKAAPLLRAWLHRLRQQGAYLHVRHRWFGWADDGALRFAKPDGEKIVAADATILALGGGSWAKLGSDGAWVPLLAARGVGVAPLRPANCGFDVAWSAHFSERYAGQPVKPVVASVAGRRQQGEFNITAGGIEGGLIYALSAPLRDALEATGHATIHLDLAPGKTLERLRADLARPRGRDSLANHLRRRAGIEGVKAGLLRELLPFLASTPTAQLAAAIKHLPLPVTAPLPSTRQSAQRAVSPSKRSTKTRCCANCRVFSVPAKCWTGRRRQGAICLLRALPPAELPGKGCKRGWHEPTANSRRFSCQSEIVGQPV